MPSKSVNASGETRCQRRAKPQKIGEGVETGWGPPDRGAKARRAGEGEGTVQPTNAGPTPAAAKAEVGWDQKSPGSSPGGATESPARSHELPGFCVLVVDSSWPDASRSTELALRAAAPVPPAPAARSSR